MLHYHGWLGSDHARLLRSFELAGIRRHYPKTSSIPSAACLPMHWYPVRVALKSYGYAGASKQVLD